MSYQPLKNEDSLSELVSNIVDLNLNLKKVEIAIKNNNFNEFILWFNKCMQINKSGTKKWIRKYGIHIKTSDEISNYMNSYIKNKLSKDEVIK